MRHRRAWATPRTLRRIHPPSLHKQQISVLSLPSTPSRVLPTREPTSNGAHSHDTFRLYHQARKPSATEEIEYHWIDGVERLDLYEAGGYHPVKIGDVLGQHYQVVDKLGYGGYSTIWLARDTRLSRYVAIKIGISGSSLAQKEPSILRALAKPESGKAYHNGTAA